jgi:hypothetical protein
MTEQELLQSHISFAHEKWSEHVVKGDLVIDATCGNGHDALYLSFLCLTETQGALIALDRQLGAIFSTKKKLEEKLTKDTFSKVLFYCQSHETFPPLERAPSLIVYNLGYLPGSDKVIKTSKETTLVSIENALSLISKGGMLSITCYPGHAEGLEEQSEILNYAAKLSDFLFDVTHYRKTSRPSAPSVLLIKKIHQD